jgi:signal transduction histidine kinase
MVFISDFSAIQVAAFLVNITVISSLVRWQWALCMTTLGIAITTFCHTNYVTVHGSYSSLLDSKFKIIYLLLLISSSLVLFLRPKQEHQERTEEKVEHLGIQIGDREEELQKSLELKYEFLRNLEHEVHTPITGITSLAQTLSENCDKLDYKQLKQSLDIIAKSSERFDSLSRNLLDLSKLSSLTYELHKANVNLSELVYDRLDHCRKLYLNDKELEFIAEIEPDIELNCDQHYITSTVDNLIINAIQYSKGGKITTKLIKIATNVEFSIQDEGIGIPKNELYDVFGAFVVSSKTHTPAGGRGVGLALCKKAIELHNGKIWAESDGNKGAVFKFTLPLVP